MKKSSLRLALLLFVVLSLIGTSLTLSVGQAHAKVISLTVQKTPLVGCFGDQCDGKDPKVMGCTADQVAENDKQVNDSTGVKAGLLRLYFSFSCGAGWAAFVEDCSYPHGNIGYLRNVQLSSDDEPSGQQEGPGYQTVSPCQWASPDVMQGIDCSGESNEDFYAHGSFHDYRGVVIVTNSVTFNRTPCS